MSISGGAGVIGRSGWLLLLSERREAAQTLAHQAALFELVRRQIVLRVRCSPFATSAVIHFASTSRTHMYPVDRAMILSSTFAKQ
jgi:hypothetical protein